MPGIKLNSKTKEIKRTTPTSILSSNTAKKTNIIADKQDIKRKIADSKPIKKIAKQTADLSAPKKSKNKNAEDKDEIENGNNDIVEDKDEIENENNDIDEESDIVLGQVRIDEKTGKLFKYVNVERTNISKEGILCKYTTRAKYFIKTGKRGRKKMPHKKELLEKIKKLTENQSKKVLDMINKYLLTQNDISEDEIDDMPEDTEIVSVSIPKIEDRPDNL